MSLRAGLILLLLTASLPAGDALRLLSYSEYLDPLIVERYSASQGVAVINDTYGSEDEMLALLKNRGAGAFDLIIATDSALSTLRAMDLLQPLDPARLPNAANIDPQFARRPSDPEGRYSIPYFWGTVGLLYDTRRFSGPAQWSWILGPGERPGRFVLIDEGRTALAVANLARGAGINARTAPDLSANLALFEASKTSAQFAGFMDGVNARYQVQGGTLAAAIVYNGDAVLAIAEHPHLAYAIPAEGSQLWTDVLVIPRQGTRQAQAYAFLDHLLGATVAAQNATALKYATPNRAALPLIPAEDRANPLIYPDAATLRRLHQLDDPGPQMRSLIATWSRIRGNGP